MNKNQLKRKIYEVDFAIYELILFLDTHPTSQKAMELLKEYRKTKEELLKIYEMNFGKWIIEHSDVSANGCFEWLKSPWPWENDNMEA